MSKAFRGICMCVCVSRTWTQKRINPVFKFGRPIGNDLGISYNWYDFEIKRSRSQGHKVQNDDRVASVSYVVYWVPSLYLVLMPHSLNYNNHSTTFEYYQYTQPFSRLNYFTNFNYCRPVPKVSKELAFAGLLSLVLSCHWLYVRMTSGP